MGRLKELINKFRLSGDEEAKEIRLLDGIISESRIKLVKNLLKKKLVKIDIVKFDSELAKDISYPQITALSKKVDVSEVNKDIKQKIIEGIFKEFSGKAFDVIPSIIAPHITGMDDVKKAVAIQLFAKQPIHILLLGDPGTGKTDILRSAFNLAPISSFGLGSGTSGVGLVVTVKGDHIMKGLIPLADGGICCIDELNLMKEESRAGLYNAMEKGFVTYDKGGNHYTFDARIKVLATANPKEDKFIGKAINELREEIPFDAALLTRFHLTFFIRKPGLKQFREIASLIASEKKSEISKDDIEIIKSYIEYSRKKEVSEISKGMQKEIVDFISEIKKDEDKYLVEVSPRLVIGFMRLCKGLALMEGRAEVSEKDVSRIKDIVKESLKIL